MAIGANNQNQNLVACMANNSDAGGIVGGLVGGAGAIAAGSPLLPYNWFGPAISGGGPSGGTSVLSASARRLLVKGFFSGGSYVGQDSSSLWQSLSGVYATGSKAAIVGQLASDASILAGVGLEAYGAYKAYQAYQMCKAQAATGH